jgi:hypothetical protein
MRRKRSRLARRYGRPAGRTMWRVLYEGQRCGRIAARDYEEALAIAQDAAPKTWDTRRIEVEPV